MITKIKNKGPINNFTNEEQFTHDWTFSDVKKLSNKSVERKENNKDNVIKMILMMSLALS